MSGTDYIVSKALRDVEKGLSLKRPSKVVTYHSTLKPVGTAGWDDVSAPVAMKVPRRPRKQQAPVLRRQNGAPVWIGEHRW